MTEPLHVIGVYWDGGFPALFVQSPSGVGHAQRIPLRTGATLTVNVRAPRLCIGYWDAASRARRWCPNQRRLTGGGGAQCGNCENRGGGFYARTGFRRETNAAAFALRNERHAAYLAFFGRDLVKVGVAAEWRKETRVLEQAAAASLVFASGDGSVIRHVEAMVVRRAALVERVTLKQKLSRLWDQPDEAMARRVLAASLEQTGYWPAQPDQRPASTKPLFRYNLPRFGLDRDAISTGHLYLIGELGEGDRVTGTIAGVFGSVILIQVGNSAPYALDSRRLQGHVVTLGGSPSLCLTAPCETVTRAATQEALFM